MPSPGFRHAAVLLLLAAGSAAQAASDIALLLPQSGRLAKAAEAIKTGFLAAYYQDSARHPDSPVVHIYDSDATEILTLVQRATQDGAGLIVGPLDRERLEVLIKTGAAPVPVLALNTAEGQAENVFEFALAPEDEIQRLVAWMENQNIKRPYVLAGSDEASQRHLKIFQALWLVRHPGTLPQTTLDPSRKGGIAATIKELTRAGGKHDAFFLASPAVARQVQPALTYYRNTLPLYTLSSAWDPTSDASGQKDLDGVRFCDQPWMLEALRPEQESLYATYPRPVSGYDRLHAFGADIWTLSQQWTSMLDGKALPLRSGLVQIDSSHYLHRTPTCAEVRNGTAIPLWSPDAVSPPAGPSR